MLCADTIIVGGGPAGLLAAIASPGKTILLEGNSAAGVKLLLSGSGQCNYSNSLDREAFLRACGSYGHFLKPALYAFDCEAFMALLAEGGCPSLTRPDGKIFPASLKAADVRDSLLRKALAAGAKVLYGQRIYSAVRGGGFTLRSAAGDEFRCSRLILAGGGCSWPQTGSDGGSYQLARALGHSIVTPKPALAAVTIRDFGAFADCAGVSLRQAEAVFHTPKGKTRARGDLLFTHQGLSGPLILDHSHLLDPGDRVSLQLVPRAEDRLLDILKLKPAQSLLQALKRFSVPESLLRALLARQGVSGELRCGEVSKALRNRVCQALSQLEFSVSGLESLATCMATSGGIPLSEVKARDMSSKLCEGLRFAGEILDYNLPTGGFNIQAAASTGWLAGAAQG